MSNAVPAGYISEEEQASRFGVTVRTLRRWRARGEGPPIVRLGHRVLYAEDAGARYLRERETAISLPSPRWRARRGGMSAARESARSVA
jgi:hypothetical protein